MWALLEFKSYTYLSHCKVAWVWVWEGAQVTGSDIFPHSALPWWCNNYGDKYEKLLPLFVCHNCITHKTNSRRFIKSQNKIIRCFVFILISSSDKRIIIYDGRYCIFSLLSSFWKNKSRLRDRLPVCVSVYPRTMSKKFLLNLVWISWQLSPFQRRTS
jgi:hypothetical protein